LTILGSLEMRAVRARSAVGRVSLPQADSHRIFTIRAKS